MDAFFHPHSSKYTPQTYLYSKCTRLITVGDDIVAATQSNNIHTQSLLLNLMEQIQRGNSKHTKPKQNQHTVSLYYMVTYCGHNKSYKITSKLDTTTTTTNTPYSSEHTTRHTCPQ